MNGGYFTYYTNKHISPSERVAQFVESEPRLTWTSLLLSDLPEAQIYLVGGTVRDVILGLLPSDIDLLVCNVASSDLERWLMRHGAVSLVESTFDTFKFSPHGERKSAPIDIALPRTERVTSTHHSGRRDLAITSNYKTSVGQDLSRRDFTINAMAYNLDTNELLDPFFGLSDLDTGTIRTVMNPFDRFYEDATRILRALRFASQLGFAIDADTWEAVVAQMDLLDNKILTENGSYIYAIPRSTIGKEFLLGFLAHPVHNLRVWLESGALTRFLPEIKMLSENIEPNNQTALDITTKALHLLKNHEFLASHNLERASANAFVATLFLFCDNPTETVKLVCKRLHLHQFSRNHLARVETETVAWLLNSLSIFETTDPASLKPSQFERLFLQNRGADLLLLAHIKYYLSGAHSIGRERVHIAKRIAGELREHLNELPRLINGADIQAFGVRPGPQYRTLIDDVRDAQLTHKIQSRQEALDLLRERISFL